MSSISSIGTEGAACEVRDTVAERDWDAYVASHPQACAYHYAGWCQLIARAFGHEPRLLAAETHGALTGVLPLVVMKSRLFGRFVISLPFLNAGGLLASDDSSRSALLDAAIRVARQTRADYLELRHRARHFPQLAERHHKVAMTLQLAAQTERQWDGLDRKVRNQVRKGQKSGLVVTDGGTEAIAPFYEVFARNMRDLGTPVFGISLFEEVLRTYPKNSRVFCVYQGGRAVAASVVHWRGASLEVIWASALRELNPLCANPLLYWHMIEFAIRQGCRIFEFGRCTPGEGTFHFKRQWGAEPSPLVWEYWAAGRPIPDLNPRNSTFRRASSVWRHLPVSVATVVGPRIVRSIPC